jgi:hypothetical protein
VPGLAEQWRGAAPDEVEQLERLAGCPLPRFYRWFLSRMGPLAHPSQGFSARRVLDCYARKIVTPHPRFLLIGYESDEMMPLHAFHDLDAPARGDATVTARYARGGDESIDRAPSAEGRVRSPPSRQHGPPPQGVISSARQPSRQLA